MTRTRLRELAHTAGMVAFGAVLFAIGVIADLVQTRRLRRAAPIQSRRRDRT